MVDWLFHFSLDRLNQLRTLDSIILTIAACSLSQRAFTADSESADCRLGRRDQ